MPECFVLGTERIDQNEIIYILPDAGIISNRMSGSRLKIKIRNVDTTMLLCNHDATRGHANIFIYSLERTAPNKPNFTLAASSKANRKAASDVEDINSYSTRPKLAVRKASYRMSYQASHNLAACQVFFRMGN